MSEIFSAISAAEAAAVGFGIAYLALAVREHIACWYAAFISTAISVYVFWDVSLFMESLLNVYYMAMAVYGWYQWRGNRVQQAGLAVSTWPPRNHLLIIGGTLSLTIISGFMLASSTSASWPFVDSFTTWGSVLTTFMVARKILENWIYWIVIDAVSIFLYLDRGLYLYAGLFVIYVIIAIFGYFGWRRSMAQALTTTRARE
jgi:nicotinamide mononucleotide transporter